MAKLQLQDCGVCGFTFHKNELRKQNGLWKCSRDFDVPKPSDKSLGGEGEIGSSDSRVNSDSYETPSESERVVFIVTNSGGININKSVPWMVITASSTIETYVLTN